MPTLDNLVTHLGKILSKGKIDIVKWVQDNCKIEDPRSKDSIIPVRLWNVQKRYLKHLLNNRLTITLKARQEGFTWLNVFFCMCMCYYTPNFRVLIFSQNKKTAKEVIRRFYFVYDNLPETTKAILKLKGRRSVENISFTNGAIVESFATTKNSGRSFAASLVFMDEADSMQFGDKLFQACKPTIDDGGSMHIVFTVNDTDGLGRKIWNLAEDAMSGFMRFFCAWYEHPGRTAEWYEKGLASSLNKKDFQREFPNNPEEALAFSAEDSVLVLDDKDLEKYRLSEFKYMESQRFVVAIDAGLNDDTFSYSEACWHSSIEAPVVRYNKVWEPVDGKVLDYDEIFKFITKRLSSNYPEKIYIDPLHIQSYQEKLEVFATVEAVHQGKPREICDTFLYKNYKTETFYYLNNEFSGDTALYETHLKGVKLKGNLGRYRMIKKDSKSKIDCAVSSSMACYGLFKTLDYYPTDVVDFKNVVVTANNQQLSNDNLISVDNLASTISEQIRGMRF